MRIQPPAPGSRPELAELEAQIVAQRGRISPLYQTLLTSPPIAHGWEQMLTAVRKHSTVPALVRELIILRVAILNGAPYEYQSHLPLALAAGASQAAVDAVGQADRIGPGLDEATQVLIELCDAMTRDVEVPDALYERVRAHYDDRQIVDACATIGAYNMVSRFLIALRVGH